MFTKLDQAPEVFWTFSFELLHGSDGGWELTVAYKVLLMSKAWDEYFVRVVNLSDPGMLRLF